MTPARDKSKLVGPYLTLVAGLCWLSVALLRVFHSHGGEVLLPCVAGLLFLASAVLGFRNWLHKPEVKRTALWPRL